MIVALSDKIFLTGDGYFAFPCRAGIGGARPLIVALSDKIFLKGAGYVVLPCRAGSAPCSLGHEALWMHGRSKRFRKHDVARRGLQSARRPPSVAALRILAATGATVGLRVRISCFPD